MNLASLKSTLDAAFHWAVQNSLPATVLIALVVLTQFAFRRTLSPRWRYALGLLILVRLALPIAPASSLSIFNLAKHSAPSSVIRPIVETVLPPMPEISLAPGEYETAPVIADLPRLESASVQPKIYWGFLAELLWLAGCAALLAAAFWRHHRFAVKLRRWGAVAEPRVLALLAECRSRMGVKRNVRMLSADGLSTPALFGHWRPALLIPGEMLRRLGDRELRHIILHELAHLKRGDILVNWAMICVRALHWFNPAVWFAFRRLRADQELACDADVMAVLDAGERRDYGGTLIKVLEDFSAAGLCPGLVPFVTRKPIIQRRIVMIAQFKPAGRMVAAASFALLVALGCFTFTRAAEKPSSPGVPTPFSDSPTTNLAVIPQPAPAESAGAAFETQVEKLEAEIHDKQMKLYELRAELGMTSGMADGNGATQASDTITRLNALRASADTEMLQSETMLNELRKLGPMKLRATLPRIVPDPILSSLVQEELATEIKLVGLKDKFGPEHPDVKSAELTQKDLEQKIDAQIEGILSAMKTKVDLARAQSERTQIMVENAKIRDQEQAQQYRPYWELKSEVDRLNRMREVLYIRMAQGRVDPRKSVKSDELWNDVTSSVPVSGVPAEARLNYLRARDMLAQQRAEYSQKLATDPQSSALVQDSQNRIKDVEAQIRKLGELYPSLRNLPTTGASVSAMPAQTMVVHIQSDGTLRLNGVNGSTLTADELTVTLGKNGPAALEIRADADTPSSAVVKVMDAARNAGVATISLRSGRALR